MLKNWFLIYLIEKYGPHYKNKKIRKRLGLKLKNRLRIRIQSIAMAKTIYQIQYKNRIEVEKA